MVVCRNIIPGKGLASESRFDMYEGKQERPVALRQSEQVGELPGKVGNEQRGRSRRTLGML